MPKQKTHRGAAKRFKKTGKGKIKRHKAYAAHLMSRKSSKRKRKLRQSTTLRGADAKNVDQLLPYE